MARSLVTGAAGFIGSHVVRALVERGDDVHAAVRATSDISRLQPVRSSVTFHETDLTNAADVARMMERVHPDHVFHLAASNMVSGKHAGAEDVIRVNVLGTSNILSSLPADVSSCINTGSFLEYGPKDRPLVEIDRCEPPELYSVTKLAGTLLSQTIARAEGKPIVVFRIFTPYGPLMQQGRLMYEAVSHALRNEPVLLSAQQVARDFIYIDDIVKLLIEGSARAGEYKGRIFNAGSGRKTTLEELADLIIGKTASTSRVEWGGFQKSSYDADSWQADMTATYAAFGWRPSVSLEEGVERMIAWLSGATGK